MHVLAAAISEGFMALVARRSPAEVRYWGFDEEMAILPEQSAGFFEDERRMVQVLDDMIGENEIIRLIRGLNIRHG
jgi:hypothetical protein